MMISLESSASAVQQQSPQHQYHQHQHHQHNQQQPDSERATQNNSDSGDFAMLVSSDAAAAAADPALTQFRDQTRFWIQRVAVPLLMVIGVFGNLITVIIMTRRRMRSTTNMYLAALALVDMFYLVLTFILGLSHYPNMAQPRYLLYWHLRPFLMMLTDACSNTSVWLTVAFTIERYIAVRYPMKGKVWCTEARARMFISCVFVFGILFAAPVPFEWKVIEKRVNNLAASNQPASAQHDTPSSAAAAATTGDTSSSGYLSVGDGDQSESYVLALDYSDFGRNETYKTIYYWSTAVIFYFIPLLSLTLFNGYLIKSVHQSKRERNRMTVGQHHSSTAAKAAVVAAATMRQAMQKQQNKLISSTSSNGPLKRESRPTQTGSASVSDTTTTTTTTTMSAVATNNFENETRRNRSSEELAEATATVGAAKPSSIVEGRRRASSLVGRKYSTDVQAAVASAGSSDDETKVANHGCAGPASWNVGPIGQLNGRQRDSDSQSLSPSNQVPKDLNQREMRFQAGGLRRAKIARSATTTTTRLTFAKQPFVERNRDHLKQSSPARTNVGQQQQQQLNHSSTSSQERRITIMLIAVVILFLFCQIPSAAMILYTSVRELEPNTNEHALVLAFGNIFNFLMAVNAAGNFILYSFLSKKYRKTFVILFCYCLKPTANSAGCLDAHKQQQHGQSRFSSAKGLNSSSSLFRDRNISDRSSLRRGDTLV